LIILISSLPSLQSRKEAKIAFLLTAYFYEALKCDLRDNPKTGADLANCGQRTVGYEEVSYIQAMIIMLKGHIEKKKDKLVMLISLLL
jgi:hypothetical protein